MKIEIALWLFLGIAIAFSIPGCKTKNQQAMEMSKFEQKVGERIILGLKEPTRVTYFAVGPKSNAHSGYDIVSSEYELPEDLRWLLQETLIDDQTYFFNKTKMCRFVPEMGFRFSGKHEVVVLVSYACRQIKFISDDRVFILDDDPKHEVFETNFQELQAHLK